MDKTQSTILGIIVAAGILGMGLALFGPVGLSVISRFWLLHGFASSNSYDPADYGLPATLNGYKTFAVLTSENTACMPPGEKRLVLQAPQDNVQSFLDQNNPASLLFGLQQSGFSDFAQGDLEYVGPGIQFEQFIAENEKWNQAMRESGCVKSGPALAVPGQ